PTLLHSFPTRRSSDLTERTFLFGQRYHGWPELAALHFGGQHRSRPRNQPRLFHDPNRERPAWRRNFARATQRLADRFHSHCFGRDRKSTRLNSSHVAI